MRRLEKSSSDDHQPRDRLKIAGNANQSST
jgi:hypothetical protein